MTLSVLEIPYQQLSPEALRGLVEEFITRDGTDYGLVEIHLPSKVEQVMGQIRRGDVCIVFDEAAETCNLISKQDLRQIMRHAGEKG